MKRNRTGLYLLFFLTFSIFSLNAVWADVANWSTDVPMPTARIGAASGVVDGKIFILGGSNTLYPPPAGTMDTVEVYDPLSSTWTWMTPLIVPRFAGGDATLGNIIYIAGGTAVGGPPAGGPNYQDTVVAYDTTTGSSSIIGYLQEARFRTDADIIGEKLYVVGGSGGASGMALDSIEEYDLRTNTSVVKATLPVPTDMPAAVAFGGKLYIMGGFDASGNPLYNCLEYDPATNALVPKNPMPMARGGMGGVVVFNDKIYVLGGAVNPGPPPITTFSDIQEYDPFSDTWQMAGVMPTERWGFAAEVSDALPDRLFLIGGSDNEQALVLNETGVFAGYSPVTIITSSLPSGITGSYYDQSLSATGGKTPYTWSLSAGVLPGGLTLNSATGLISGAPAASGTFTFTAQVSDGNSNIDLKTFSISVYDPLFIEAVAGANGNISPSGSVRLDRNAGQIFIITPDTGYHVSDVIVDGASVGPVTVYTFNNVTANHTIQATFAINTYSITASAGPNGSLSPSGSFVVNYGETRTFTIIPAAGYHISDVMADGVSAGAVPAYTFTNVTADHTLHAVFEINTYRLSVAKGGTGSGAVTSSPAGIDCGPSCSAAYDYGTIVTLNAVSSPDSFFAGWSGGGCQGTGSCTVAVDADNTATAVFTQYITVTAPNGGEIRKVGSTYDITWNYAGDPGSTVRIELLKGTSVVKTLSKKQPIGASGTGSFSWTVQGSVGTGPDFRIRITSTSNQNYTDTGDADFSITRQSAFHREEHGDRGDRGGKSKPSDSKRLHQHGESSHHSES